MLTLVDLEARARAQLPEAAYDYFAGGAGDERTLDDNVQAWRQLWLVPRHGAGVGAVDTATELAGGPAAAPVVLAPVAALGLLHPDRELGAARAAAAAGLPMTLSSRSTSDMAEVVAAAAGGRVWLQLYPDRDQDRTRAVLRRAAEVGVERVVLTIDLPAAGRRERERRHGPVAFPEGIRLTDHLGGYHEAGAKPDAGSSWAAVRFEDVAWIREASGLPVDVKGVLCAYDAHRALDAGADGIVVSNHGGRQLEGTIPTAVALAEVAEAAAGKVPVLVDGGLRSGEDIVRALALGADGVMLGRSWIWGLATGGQAGVAQVLAAVLDDLALALALVGAADVSGVLPDHVRARTWGA